MMTIRMATPADAPAICAIYAPFITGAATSFEQEVPSAQEMQQRIADTQTMHPWLVLDVDGTVAGYAYAGLHRKREAYQWATETSVYVAEDFRKRGVATALYTTLLHLLKVQGFQVVFAGMTLPNPGSAGFHAAMGFREFAVYERVGYKFGQWWATSWWRLELAKAAVPPALIPVGELVGTEEWKRAVREGLGHIKPMNRP